MQIAYKEAAKRRFGVELEVSSNLTRNAIGKLLREYESSQNHQHEVVVTTGKGSSGWAETRANRYWHVKYDSTCGPLGKGKDHGWEVASYIGGNQVDLFNISQAANHLHRGGVETNRNCGLHIHADVQDFDVVEMGVLLARWANVEDLLVSICNPYRDNNKYCRRLCDRWMDRSFWSAYHPEMPQQFWADMAPSNLGTHNNSEKKLTLNTVGWATGQVVPYYNRQTVELRLPECILASQHILHWGRLFLNFVEGCKGATVGPPEIQKTCSVANALKFLNLQGDETFFLLGNLLWDTKLWFLRKIASGRGTPDQAEEAADLIEFVSEI
jgi:hypothetical protein